MNSCLGICCQGSCTQPSQSPSHWCLRGRGEHIFQRFCGAYIRTFHRAENARRQPCEPHLRGRRSVFVLRTQQHSAEKTGRFSADYWQAQGIVISCKNWCFLSDFQDCAKMQNGRNTGLRGLFWTCAQKAIFVVFSGRALAGRVSGRRRKRAQRTMRVCRVLQIPVFCAHAEAPGKFCRYAHCVKCCVGQ